MAAKRGQMHHPLASQRVLINHHPLNLFWALQKAADPLPPAVPLPAPLAQNEVLAPKSDSTDADQQGGVTPAAGMAAVITNAQGSGEKHKLDGSDVPK